MAHIPKPVAGLALALGAMLAAALPVHAQGAGTGFLFKEPVLTVTARGGFAQASANSDIFAFATEHLTVQRGDFSGPGVGADVAIRVTPRFDLTLGAAYADRSTRSEFRDWVDNDDLPIEQTTEFQRVPLTIGVKALLLPRGRSIGRFAWLPNRVVPYVGAGAGTMWYRFRQQGDFVDFETLDVFYDEIESSGWTPVMQALGGVDFALTPRLVLTGEARYLRASDELGDDFQDFDPIDLSGLSATLGFSIRL